MGAGGIKLEDGLFRGMAKPAKRKPERQRATSQEGWPEVDQGEALGGEDPTTAYGALSRKPMLNSVSSNGLDGLHGGRLWLFRLLVALSTR